MTTAGKWWARRPTQVLGIKSAFLASTLCHHSSHVVKSSPLFSTPHHILLTPQRSPKSSFIIKSTSHWFWGLALCYPVLLMRVRWMMKTTWTSERFVECPLDTPSVSDILQMQFVIRPRPSEVGIIISILYINPSSKFTWPPQSHTVTKWQTKDWESCLSVSETWALAT